MLCGYARTRLHNLDEGKSHTSLYQRCVGRIGKELRAWRNRKGVRFRDALRQRLEHDEVVLPALTCSNIVLTC